MELAEKIAELSARIKKQKLSTLTEEAVKTAFVLPFIQALDYDVFNPSEVIPEFTADHGVKKGEKVDYVIKINNEIVILIECKLIGAELASKHASQLFRYFSVTDAKISILTDGIKYLFYSDLEKENKMDERSFFEFDICNYQESQIDLLRKFSKPIFDVEKILKIAVDLKYSKALIKAISQEFNKPSESLVKYLTSQVYGGRLTPLIKNKFDVLVTQSLKDFLRAEVNQRLEMALEKGNPEKVLEDNSTDCSKNLINTTPEENESHMIIRAISAEITNCTRVTLRDGQAYCAILFDDNNRKPIARLYFKKTKMSIGVFVNNSEQRFDITATADIYLHKKLILDCVNGYLKAPV